MRKAFILLAIVSLLGSAALLQSRYDLQAPYFVARRVSVTLPKASTLKVISLGFHDALAELLFLWSIQFYSTTYYANRWDSLEGVFETIVGISPDNPDFYLTGSVMMAREANQVEAALRLLQKAADHFKNDYIYEYWAGFFAATILKDYERAAAFQERAAKRPNALPGIINLYAHYVYQQDDLEKAWKLFSELKRTTPHESVRRSADLHLYDIQYERDEKIFEEIRDRFTERYGRFPASIDEMVQRKFLSAPPVDYKGDAYRYDPGEGRLLPNQDAGWKKRS